MNNDNTTPLTPEEWELINEMTRKILRKRVDFPPIEVGFACGGCGRLVRSLFMIPGRLSPGIPEDHVYACGCGFIFYDKPFDFDPESWFTEIGGLRAKDSSEVMRLVPGLPRNGN